MKKIGFKDTDGIDLGYKLVRKKEIDVEKEISGPKRSLGGTLWIWGCEDHGQLGRNCRTFSSILSPVQTVAKGNNWKQACVGRYFSAATKTDGTLWTWGRNCEGELADNTTISKSSPVQTISGGTNWKHVQAVGNHAMALKTDGTLWSWGSGLTGSTANGSCINRCSPAQVSAGGLPWSRFCMIPAPSGGGAGIRNDGTLWTWGYTFTRSTVCTPFLNRNAGYYWRDVAVGFDSLAAIKTDGTLWTLGDYRGRANPYAQGRFFSFPVQEFSCSTDWKKVVSYKGDCININICNFQSGFLALKCDGTLWGWAGRTCNVLIPDCLIDTPPAIRCGISPTPKIFKPVLNITGCTKWKEVATNTVSGVGIKEDGTLWGWGKSRLVGISCINALNECFLRCPVQLAKDKQSWKTISISCGNIVGITGD
jgi:alpha-tubulin suppressor-like RCC1 family protein